MKKRNILRIIPLVIAVLLISAGAIGVFAVTSSGLPFESRDYTAHFYMNHLQVHLLENGIDVCGGENTLDGDSKITGDFLTALGSEGEKLGTADPGRHYTEEITAKNGQDIPIYLRITVRKYWVFSDEGAAGDKAPKLSPDLIHLTYGDKDYNTAKWVKNEKESTRETSVYYYRTELAAGATADQLFDSLMIDPSILDKYEEEVTTKPDPDNPGGTVTIKTYVYRYDGAAFVIKADVQAVQTHNATDAIKSQWGVDNVSASNGVLSVE